MKIPLLTLVILFVLSGAAAAQPAPQPSVEARLLASKTNPFVKETITLILEITTRDIEIDPQLDLAQLPANDVVHILSSFEAMAVQRERTDHQEVTRRRYRAQARAMVPGSIELAPVLQLTTRKRVRSFFGSAMEVRPVQLQIAPITFTVQPIPQAPENVSGIIGDFTVNIEAAPRDIQVGDLVNITTTIRGEGWIPENAIPAMGPSPFLRAYRVRPIADETAADRHVFAQTVVPLSLELQELPAIPFIWFDTKSGTFQRQVFGPFPLRYTQDAPEKPVSTETPEIINTNAVIVRQQGLFQRDRATVTQNTRVYLAPASTSKSTFIIPATGIIRILSHQQDWLLIEHDNNRGWIPAATLTPPAH